MFNTEIVIYCSVDCNCSGWHAFNHIGLLLARHVTSRAVRNIFFPAIPELPTYQFSVASIGQVLC